MDLNELGITIDTLSREELATINIEDYQEPSDENEKAIYHYFLGNYYSKLRDDKASWQSSELEKAIFHYRCCLQENLRKKSPEFIQLSAITNLANMYLSMGRYVEAIKWYHFIFNELDSNWGVAWGSYAEALLNYGRHMYLKSHKNEALFEAWKSFNKALDGDLTASEFTHEKTTQLFIERKKDIEKNFDPHEYGKNPLKEYSLGDSQEEINYRQWCLKKRLFLNPMNDLGTQSWVAQDVLNLPTIVHKKNYLGCFNQIKREFITSRFMLWEGISSPSKEPHFSDKEMNLYDTLDSPAYSLAHEKIKISFRVSYSIFDKIAFFLDDYFGLDMPKERINFLSIWRNKNGKTNSFTLKNQFANSHNTMLRALYCLSKDIHMADSRVKNTIDPYAEELRTIRNFIEHRYLKLHTIGSGEGASIEDELAHSINVNDFSFLAERLLHKVRSAMIYLVGAIYTEEYFKAENTEQQRFTIPINLPTLIP